MRITKEEIEQIFDGDHEGDFRQNINRMNQNVSVEKPKRDLLLEIFDEINSGGEWLGAARTWMQSNIKNGDTLCWSSAEYVKIPFCDLEQFAKHVAANAIYYDRKNR